MNMRRCLLPFSGGLGSAVGRDDEQVRTGRVGFSTMPPKHKPEGIGIALHLRLVLRLRVNRKLTHSSEFPLVMDCRCNHEVISSRSLPKTGG